MNVAALEPRRHAPPQGWAAATFERLTDALAAALVAAVRHGSVTLTEPSGETGREPPSAASDAEPAPTAEPGQAIS